MPSPAEQLDRARKDELLDLTLRNPLISHRMRKTRGLELMGTDPVALFDRLVGQERTVQFETMAEEANEPNAGNRSSAATVTTPYDEDRLQSRLLTTYRRARTLMEEEGINTLCIALGMLRWFESPSSDRERHAPLLLIPVELSRTDVRGRFRLGHTGEEWAGNLSLKAYLRENFGLTLPMPPEPEEGALDLAAYRRQIEEVIDQRNRWRVDPGAIVVDFFSLTDA